MDNLLDTLPPEIILQIAEEVEKRNALPQFMKAYPRAKEVVRQMGDLDIPRDMMQEIMSHLSSRDLARLGSSSSSLAEVTKKKRLDLIRRKLKELSDKLDKQPQIETDDDLAIFIEGNPYDNNNSNILYFKYLYPLMNLIQENFYLWSDPSLKSKGYEFLEQIKNKVNEDVTGKYGLQNIIEAVKDYIKNIKPRVNETNKDRFLDTILYYDKQLNELSSDKEDLRNTLIDIIDFIYHNINYVNLWQVKHLLNDIYQIIDITWNLFYTDDLDIKQEYIPTFFGRIEKLLLLLDQNFTFDWLFYT